MATALPTLVVAKTYRLRHDADLDGEPWDLTDATVYVHLKDPNGQVTRKTATVTDAAGGVADYVTVAADLHTPGDWSVCWQVVQGSIDVATTPFEQPVVESP